MQQPHDAVSQRAIDAIAKAYGLNPEKTGAAAAVITDALTQRIEQASLSRSGLADVIEIIGAPGRQAYSSPDTPLAAPQVRADGIGILSQLVGSKDQSRALAARAARRSGLSEEAVKSMLPSLAAVLMGAISERSKQSFGDILKIPGLDEVAKEARDDIGGGGQLAPPQYGSPLPLPGEPPFHPDPNADWTGSAGRAAPEPQAKPRPRSQPGGAQRSPLPIPGDDVPGMGRHEDNPYGDLADILRRGGFRLPGGIRIPGGGPPSGRAPAPAPQGGGLPDLGAGSAGGGLLESIIRNVLGNVLGYQPRGVVGWIIRLIIMRWGLSFVRSLLRRVLGINI